MNENKEMLDKIMKLKILHPEAQVIFLVSTETCDEHDYEEQTLKSVEFDVVAKIEKADSDVIIITGKENIEDYLESQIFENELSLADGNFDIANNRNPEETINLKAKDEYEKYQKDGTIVPTIIVFLGA
jgi:hypothetical protein